MSKFYQNPFCNKCGRFHLDPDDLCGYSNRQQPVEAEGSFNSYNLGFQEGYNHAIDDAVDIIKHSDTKFEAMDAITALKK